ncbi:nitrate reductase molybdenum cofactor assembly chaperone [Mixta sp.]|uniref:nitrate reductase molybdenum cofactor assembly chaperone n=1 Tax=Mixta sp. TaxID=2100765 RepID=UPI0025881E2E|nr:nitrate reductase molybdenum cofactor assembly chaperone [Mixta sp.]MCR1566888.1 nitrate reductase molybdenum cofactor assembly chaperone [Mixta sp.]
MQMLKIVALLLEYPEKALWEEREELCALVAQRAPMLQGFVDGWLGGALLDRQSEWCETFDRGCATSLLLFEHVHGESRDRGQAMVDLLSQYEQAGLLLNCRELPDYLPLYLEYLSLQPEPAARQGIQDVAPILALLGGRLQQRGSAFSQLFDALLVWAGSPLRSSSVAAQVSKEPRDDTRQALDAVWEEAQIKFIDDRAQECDSAPEKAHQQRIQQQTMPQYLDLSAGGAK